MIGHDAVCATSRMLHAESRFSLGAVTKITMQYKYRLDMNRIQSFQGWPADGIGFQ
jgi:hypothetical protein